MSDVPLPPGLNVILGDSAASTFQRVFRPTSEQLDIDRDVLSCGPTRACANFDDWDSMRAAFWNSGPTDPHDAPQPRLESAVRADWLREAAQVNIWAGTGLSEQLSAAYTIHLAEAGRATRGKLWIVQFEHYHEGRDEVFGLGILDEEAMARHPEPRPLSDDELQNYRDLWAAITASEPGLLERFSPSHPRASQWLQRAPKLLLRRFPERASGLNFWDRALLAECAARNRKAARIIGDIIGKYWGEYDPVGDLFLFARLMGLSRASLPKPLLESCGTGTNMRETEVKLTPFGLDVLEGRASNYPANPIEDWAAGVRLSSRDGNLWFNDGGTLVRAS
jgi:hypothetical protein